MKPKKLFLLLFLIFSLPACTTIKAAGSLAKFTGKAVWETAKFSGKTAYHSSKFLHKGIRTAVYMAKGKQIIPLQKEQNSLYTKVMLNKKISAKLLVDTGASSMQISNLLAAKLKINLDKSEPVYATLAGGHTVEARSVILKEVRLGNVRVKNVRAVVLNNDNMQDEDGLLGMSFFNHFDFKINPTKPELILQQKVVSS